MVFFIKGATKPPAATTASAAAAAQAAPGGPALAAVNTAPADSTKERIEAVNGVDKNDTHGRKDDGQANHYLAGPAAATAAAAAAVVVGNGASAAAAAAGLDKNSKKETR